MGAEKSRSDLELDGIIADVRPIRAIDQSAVRRLIVDGLGEHFGGVDEEANPDLEDIIGNFVDRGADFVVAVDHDGAIVGTGCLLREDLTTGRLVRMSTAPHCRRHGVASRVLDHLLRRAGERGFSQVIASTEPDWEDAVGFYLSHGFEQFDSDPIDVHLRKQLR